MEKELKLPKFKSVAFKSILFGVGCESKEDYFEMDYVDPNECCKIVNDLLYGGVVVLDLNSPLIAALRSFLTSRTDKRIFFNYDTGMFQADGNGQNIKDAYLFFNFDDFLESYKDSIHLEYARKVATHLFDGQLCMQELGQLTHPMREKSSKSNHYLRPKKPLHFAASRLSVVLNSMTL